MMVEALKNEPASTPCVFSDQMGRGRTTTGMIGACLIKEIQITTELRSGPTLLVNPHRLFMAFALSSLRIISPPSQTAIEIDQFIYENKLLQ